ncbi:MAG: cytochrome C [Planctomycetota bacterium]|jgi:hypothetical protein
MDWFQLWDIVSKPDNVPIVLLMVTFPLCCWYGLRQARKNDRLIQQLEHNPEMAETHHRKTEPYQQGWPKVVHVWPYLLKVELLAAIIVTVILIVWSIILDAPLEEPANPNLTMNPSKAPWYFLGLQEMLVYFDPWIAGVVLPILIIVGLMVIPYCDRNPAGNGYYTFGQRKYAITIFFFGFILWVVLIFVGVFIRGPGWMWFWPGQTWDHHRMVHEVNRDFHEVVGLSNPWTIGLFGAAAVGIYALLGTALIHVLYKKYKSVTYARMNILQYGIMMFFLLTMFSLPIKILLRLLFRIKYVWVTPWFNI